jgi:hypothetical protein
VFVDGVTKIIALENGVVCFSVFVPHALMLFSLYQNTSQVIKITNLDPKACT